MNAMRMIAVVLVIAGAVGIYGSLVHTRDDIISQSDTADSVAEEEQAVQVPLWLGVVVFVAGGILFFSTRRRSWLDV